MLAITKTLPEIEQTMSIPTHIIPEYKNHWEIFAMVGPYDEGYIVSEDIETIYSTEWYVHSELRTACEQN